jgi:hypothetical protein
MNGRPWPCAHVAEIDDSYACARNPRGGRLGAERRPWERLRWVGSGRSHLRASSVRGPVG